MLLRVTNVYRPDVQKQDHRQTKAGDKKKTEGQFKDVLDKAMTDKKRVT